MVGFSWSFEPDRTRKAGENSSNTLFFIHYVNFTKSECNAKMKCKICFVASQLSVFDISSFCCIPRSCVVVYISHVEARIEIPMHL